MQYVVLFVVLALIALAISQAVRIIPQAEAGVVERLGKYHRTFGPGLNFLIPGIERICVRVDLREQVVSFPPQPVITEDNLVVNIDTVVYFQVTSPKDSRYEIQNYIMGIEQLVITTLRNAVGGLDLEAALTSRDQINATLRGVLDDATGKWGVRVNRVEIKAIEPPPSVQESMEKQMRADRDKRAAILTAEGEKQSQILTAEGAKQADVLRAEGEAQAAVLRATGEAQAIQKVFDALQAANISEQALAYQYLQQLPVIANGTASKVWVIPTELSAAANAISKAFGAKD